MTVIPYDQLMTLICDSCAETVETPARPLPDAEVVWTVVSEQGWTGSPFAIGPHRCPRCALPTIGAGPDRGAPETPASGAAVRAALATATTVGDRVVVDLAGLTVIDPDDLGLLVRARGTARERGQVLCLAAPSRFVRTVLHTMRLDTAFPIFESVPDAVADLSAQADRPALPADDGPDVLLAG